MDVWWDSTYGRDGNAVGNLAQDRASGSQGRRGNGLTGVVIDDNRSDGVENNLKGLEHVQSFRKVPRLAHLREQTKEGNVGTVGEDNVGHGSEGVVQISVNSSLQGGVSVVLNTNCHHGDDNSSQDTNERYKQYKLA